MARDHDDVRAERARNLGSLILRDEREGDAHVIELLGELDIAGAPRLEEELRRVEATDADAIIIDMSGLEFIDSTGVRLLLMCADRCSDGSGDAGRLTILRGPKQVHRVFEITGLVDRLPFADA